MQRAIGAMSATCLALALAACATGSEPQVQAQAFASPEEARLVGLARDIDSRGEHGTALPLYERAAEISEGAPAAQARLGEARLRTGDQDGALAAFEAALRRDPNYAPALLGYGTVKLNRGETADAVRRLSAAAPRVGTASAYNRLGTALVLDGKAAEARAAYGQARRIEPQNIDFLANLALAEALSGDYDPAIRNMQAASGSPLAKPRHHKNLIVVLALAGRDAEAASVASSEITEAQKKALIARAKKFGAIADLGERARAIGTMAGA